VDSSTLVTEYGVTIDGVPHQLFRVAHANQDNTSDAVINRMFTLTARRQVDVLLVGGGGSGGPLNTEDNFRTGGGGAGEVHQVSLGAVPAATTISVSVGGRSLSGGSGTDTTAVIGGTLVAQARGGGRGGGSSAVAPGGSGGGGRSGDAETRVRAVAGSIGVGAGMSLRSDGAVGSDDDGGGGGGAGGDGSAPTTPTTRGGAGGAGVDIAEFFGTWDGLGPNDPLIQRYVAAGGGGGGLSTGGSGGGVAGEVLGGQGASRNPQLVTSTQGRVATGSGGGGGATDPGGDTANTGRGGSGAAWVRVRLEPLA
jgi:hypothetical protein